MNIKEEIKDQIGNQTIFKLRKHVLNPPFLEVKERIGGYPINNKLWFDFHSIYNQVTIQVYNHIKNNIKC